MKRHQRGNLWTFFSSFYPCVFPQTSILREGHVSIPWEDSHLQSKGRSLTTRHQPHWHNNLFKKTNFCHLSHLICGILLWQPKNIVTKLENSFQWFLLPAICCLNIAGLLLKRVLQKWWHVAPRQGQKKVHVLFYHSLGGKPFTML